MAVVVVVAGEGNFVRGSLEQWFLTGGGANLPREGVNKFPGGGREPLGALTWEVFEREVFGPIYLLI